MSGYIIKLDSQVKRTGIKFKNRYGFVLAGDLYESKTLDNNKQYPAIIIGAPYGGVKEQGPCVYAQELAKRGYVCLTFDQVFMGESGGEPRRVSSPELFTESFSAAVDYLGCCVNSVDRNKIGVIGICGSGGFALSSAAIDPRIKAVATASMYDMSACARMMDAHDLENEKKRLALKRWEDYENGTPEYIPSFPEAPLNEVPSELPEPAAEWFRFYAVKRGFHKNARGGFTTTSNLSFMNTALLANIKEIAPRPILFLMGDRAHSKFFSEHAYEEALEPKEIYVVDDAEHIDLYDRMDRIPFDKLDDFFTKAFM